MPVTGTEEEKIQDSPAALERVSLSDRFRKVKERVFQTKDKFRKQLLDLSKDTGTILFPEIREFEEKEVQLRALEEETARKLEDETPLRKPTTFERMRKKLGEKVDTVTEKSIPLIERIKPDASWEKVRKPLII